ncbi:MAG: rod shape-determining protein RodA [Alistipes sp.]|nr:rod shape-determining protein RodA [Alistipes sp.]
MAYEHRGKSTSLFGSVDKVTLLLYLLLTLVGVLAVFSASWVEGAENVMSFTHNYIKQITFLIVSLIVGVVIMLLERSLWHKIAYYLYGVAILALVATLLFGHTVNGATAWFEFGPIRLQTMELAKIAIALATARLMSEYNFSIKSFKSLAKVAMLLIVPLFITYMQNDTGSGLVLCSFILMLYREGLNKWICIPIIFIAVLFLLSFLYSPMVLLVSLILVFTLSACFANNNWKQGVMYLAALFGGSTLLFLIFNVAQSFSVSYYTILLVSTLLSLIGVSIYAYRERMRSVLIMVALAVASIIITPTSNALFNILKPHQQDRIMTYLGKTDDASLNYNVRQSKIAIGSGGFFGKGYLQGSNIRYGLVPEKHTDFIFCTIGEEFGFFGTMVVLGLMFAFILRLMRMGDRQRETFGRVYCYIVASILLFHTLINVGMTIGLVPVMGIPLPLISYGGSSLLSFSIMIFIALAFDAQTARNI